MITKAEKTFGSRYSRQALDRHARIKIAYQAAKERLAGLDDLAPKRLSEAEKRKRLDDYDSMVAEMDRLKRENEALLWQFVRWEYNALKHGLSKRALDAPLPEPDRGQTQKRKQVLSIRP